MDKRLSAVVVGALTASVLAACSSADPGSQPGSGISASATPTFVIPESYALQQSPDFTITLTTTSVGGTPGRLDRKHSCERGDRSPHLAWKGVPEGAESLALVVEDPASDVLGFSVDVLWAHWVVYSIPPDVTELAPGQVAGDVLENGARAGRQRLQKRPVQRSLPNPKADFSAYYSTDNQASCRRRYGGQTDQAGGQALPFQALCVGRPGRSPARGRPRYPAPGDRRPHPGRWRASRQLQVRQQQVLLPNHRPGGLPGTGAEVASAFDGASRLLDTARVRLIGVEDVLDDLSDRPLAVGGGPCRGRRRPGR